MEKTKRKKLLKGIYVVATICIIVLFVALNPGSYNIANVLKQMNLWWALLAVASALLYWFSESVVLEYVTDKLAKKMGFWLTFKIVMIGFYYSAVTPFASGGQPAQIVYMKRDANIPVGQSTSIFCIKFILFQYAVIFCAIIALIFRGNYYYKMQPHIFWISLLGFFFSLCLMIGMALLMLRPSLVNKVGGGIIKLLAKMRIVKNPDSANSSLAKTMDDFRISIEFSLKHIKQILGISIMSLVQVFIFFSTTFFIYKSFGLTGSNYFDIMALSTFLYLTISFIPIPGSSFAAEGGFLLFFSPIFVDGTLTLALVIWRFLQYYSHFFVGGLFVLVDGVGIGRKRKRKIAKTSE